MVFIREGGWPMYPILALALGGLALSLRYAFFPQRSLRALTISLIVSTVVMGLLGTVLGIQHSAEAIPDVDREMRWIFIIGLREASNCVVAALALSLPACLAVGIGSWRISKRVEEIAHRTHA